MYDTLNGNQVKLFKVPFLIETDGSYEIQEGLGSFYFFSNGDEVPFRTPYYDYTENFVIFDYMSKNNPIHIIKNGKLFKSLSLKEMASFQFDDCFKVFGNYGERVSISCYEDMLSVIDDFKKYDNIASAIRRKNLEELREIAAIEDVEEKRKRILAYQENDKSVEVANAYTLYMRKWIMPSEDKVREKFGMLKFIYEKSEDVNIKAYCSQEMKKILKDNTNFFNF